MSGTRAAGASAGGQRFASVVAWTAWAVTAACLTGQIVVSILARTDNSDWFTYVVGPICVMGMATVGTLIVSRGQGNTIGWILVFVAAAYGVSSLAGAYAWFALDEATRPLPAVTPAAILNRISVPAVLLPLPLLFLLFPDGRVPSPRWRPVLWVLVSAIAVNVLAFIVTPGPLSSGFTEIRNRIDNPLSMPLGWKPSLEVIATVAGFIVFLSALLSVVALIFRFRRSRGDERQQIKWLVYVGAADLLVVLTGLAIALVRVAFGIHAPENDPAGNVLFIVFFLVLLIGIPAACAIAAFKYRLYELDIVVKKTVVFAVLGLFVSALYLVVLVVLGATVARSREATVAFVIGAIGALAFQPVRRFASRVADRVVYGKRATPYEVLSEFSERMAGTYATEDVLPRMAEILGRGCGGEQAAVWLRIGGELRLTASWPTVNVSNIPDLPLQGDDLPSFDDSQEAFAVQHRGELLGALTVRMPVTDPMNPARAKLASDVAAQAGLVLRNVRLIEELRASRRRIVSAQDERAKALERNIHDGAQQQLVALTVKARLAQTVAEKDPAKTADLLGSIQAELQEALDNLRDLARGIYPPLLADRGLGEALAAHARKSAFPTEVDVDGVGRYSPEVEAAVYFCALEALQNTAKYANASRASIRLSSDDGSLKFVVHDDGRGFDPSATPRGAGLQNMADRLEALGGMLHVVSTPGAGTTVSGTVPIGGDP
jgi:signal transduction histidine kinase